MTEKKTSDEQLALELFAGRMVRTKRGRLKLEYALVAEKIQQVFFAKLY